MKSIFSTFIFFLFLFTTTLQAQQEYTIDGQRQILSVDVDGTLTLLWNTIDGEFRYFSKKDDTLIELKNTKLNGEYQLEYKEILRKQTNDAPVSTENLKFTLPALHAFFVEYNKKIDPNFDEEKKSIALQFRLGAFGGISNSVYTENPTNATQVVAGIDFEVVDVVKLKRHALLFRFKQTMETDEYAYGASQLSLNYRFKFVKTPKLDVFVNTKFAALTFSNREYTVPADDGSEVEVKDSGSTFNAPLTFGLGMDYKLGNGYLSFGYNDIIGLSVDNNGEFPIDFTLGYKFNL